MARRPSSRAFSRRGRGGGSAQRHRAISLRDRRHLQDVRVRERRYRPQGNRHRRLALPSAGGLRERPGHAAQRRGARTPRLPRRRAPCRALAGSRVRRVQGPLGGLRPARSRRQLPRLDGPGPPAQRRGRDRPPLVGRGRHRGLPRAGARAARAQGGRRDPVPRRDARGRQARHLPRDGRRPGSAPVLRRPEAGARGRYRHRPAAGRAAALAPRPRRRRRLARAAQAPAGRRRRAPHGVRP